MWRGCLGKRLWCMPCVQIRGILEIEDLFWSGKTKISKNFDPNTHSWKLEIARDLNCIQTIFFDCVVEILMAVQIFKNLEES
jgi:hypothetical protein